LFRIAVVGEVLSGQVEVAKMLTEMNAGDEKVVCPSTGHSSLQPSTGIRDTEFP